MKQLVVSAAARADLKTIARYSEREWGKARKKQYLSAIRGRAGAPHAGRQHGGCDCRNARAISCLGRSGRAITRASGDSGTLARKVSCRAATGLNASADWFGQYPASPWRADEQDMSSGPSISHFPGHHPPHLRLRLAHRAVAELSEEVMGALSFASDLENIQQTE